MNVMRVTQTSRGMTALRDMQLNQSRLADTQSRLSSGKAIQRGSDDPTGTLTIMAQRAQLATSSQLERNSAAANGWVGATDNAVITTSDLLGRAQSLLVQAGNTSDANARSALASELDGIRSELLGLANSTHQGRPLFSGTAAGPAFDTNGEYQGNTAAVRMRVSADTRLAVNVTGEELFGANGTGPADPAGNTFQMLAAAITAVSSGDRAGVATALDGVKVAQNRAESAIVTVGTAGNRIERLGATNADAALETRLRLAQLEEADLATEVVNATSLQISYEAALRVAANTMQTSLVNFLR